MTAVYIVKERASGLFVGRKGRVNTHNIDKARIYARVCDVKNSLAGQTPFDVDYEIIKCEVIPQFPKEYYRVQPTIERMLITTDGTHWKPQVFTSLKDAKTYVQLSSKACNLYHSYFSIVKISQEQFDKEKPSGNIRPNWRDYFLGLALVISRRSGDIHTKHGCVIVDGATNRIIGSGYNHFPRGMRDDTLPTNRPDPAHPELDDKYSWMIHSEVNACNNLTQNTNKQTVAYITGEPCTPCLMHLWQNGIQTVVHLDAYGSKYLIDEKTRERRQILLDQTGMTVYVVKADLSWLSAVVSPK